MIKSCDSGSLPFLDNSEKFLEGAKYFNLPQKKLSTEYFEKCVIKSFLDKIRVGIDVPNYPQFRDMNQMFLTMMDGLEKFKEGYLETSAISLKTDNCLIPELAVIEKSSPMIQEETGKQFEVRVCITGPYTLSSFFPYRDEAIFRRIGNVISQILEKNLFINKHGKTSLVSVDEPIFGLIDDPNIDFGSGGRENLLKSWETICSKAKSKNAQTMIHLHSTSNPLFWEIPSINVIDTHVADPLIRIKKTDELLKTKDKFLKASLTVSDFDILIKEKILADSQEKMVESDVNERIANIWTSIRNGTIDSEQFLETVDTMKHRLDDYIKRFDAERILFAGPECGLKAYPTYQIAFECLRRVARAVREFEK